MVRRLSVILLLVRAAGLALGQTETEEAEEKEPDEAPAEVVEEELPEIDVWAEDDDDEDVFIPTERISADASIAFPVDI